MTAVALAESWLYDTLATDSQLAAAGCLGVYSLPAPEGSPYPFVVFGSLAGKDTTGLGAIRTLSVLTYVVRAVINTGSLAVLDAIQARVDALLQGGKAVLTGGFVLGCIRVMQTSLGSASAGVVYKEIVSTYQITVREGVVP